MCIGTLSVCLRIHNNILYTVLITISLVKIISIISFDIISANVVYRDSIVVAMCESEHRKL